MPFSGHCLCGDVTYVSSASSPDLVAYCHCDDCQRHSGSTYAFFIIVPPDTVTAQGLIKTFVKQGTSGCPVLRKFCQNCGSSLFDEAKSTPQELAIMAGSLVTQQKRLLRPSVEMWVASKLPFCQKLSERYVHMPE
ncbi:hypothetical protein ASPVEDRAFT_176372 [Aspergillus versicolor CBS 583.65]|uniref:CENP-V/GFA domain-containing protein n=1 Tax=Aspergillus versicolor CBS 583.65 TaxID=1036611 RepID=A0A1L9PYN7_ASPVE|nr:uncharacterized protein ASPVEDRAFT_176372 [Aspergillus versicolor CBS 583.65]OJJ06552.1 hypothetical protein ASPVEDRAFT_176372 [Aspergillus versicolor CBS 583.65]